MTRWGILGQNEVAKDVATAIGVEREALRAAGLRAGSVIVDLVIDCEAEDEEVRGARAWETNCAWIKYFFVLLRNVNPPSHVDISASMIRFECL